MGGRGSSRGIGVASGTTSEQRTVMKRFENVAKKMDIQNLFLKSRVTVLSRLNTQEQPLFKKFMAAECNQQIKMIFIKERRLITARSVKMDSYCEVRQQQTTSS